MSLADNNAFEAVLGVNMGKPIVISGEFVALLCETFEAIKLSFGL